MAELSITAANVTPGATAFINSDYLAGESGTAGMVVYHRASDSRWYKAQADGTLGESGSGSTVGPGGIGIVTNTMVAGQPCAVQKSGSITIGATVVAGQTYYLGKTAGSIGLFSDLTTGNYATRVGMATTTASLNIDLYVSGLTIA